MSQEQESQWKLRDPNTVVAKDIKDEFEVRETDIEDFRKLISFHYISTISVPGIHYFGLFHKETGDIYAMIVYVRSLLNIGVRKHTLLGRILNRYRTTYEKNQVMNKIALRGCRLVLHPSIRGIGISNWFVQQAHDKLNIPFIEYLSLMSYYHRFLPLNYDNYFRITKLADTDDLFQPKVRNSDNISSRARIGNRLRTPIQKYGYTLYIKKDVLKKPEFSKYM